MKYATAGPSVVPSDNCAMEKSAGNSDEYKVGFNLGRHDSALVGNRRGLENLREAIDEAIEKGSSDRASGDILGVDCLSDEAMDELYSGGTWPSKVFGISLALAVLVVFGIGLAQIVSWIWPACCSG